MHSLLLKPTLDYQEIKDHIHQEAKDQEPQGSGIGVQGNRKVSISRDTRQGGKSVRVNVGR